MRKEVQLVIGERTFEMICSASCAYSSGSPSLDGNGTCNVAAADQYNPSPSVTRARQSCQDSPPRARACCMLSVAC